MKKGGAAALEALSRQSGWLGQRDVPAGDPRPPSGKGDHAPEPTQASAPPLGDGTSWATAFRYLPDGLGAHSQCRPEIWVAQGTYVPLHEYFRSPADPNFRIRPGVVLYGGFPVGGGDWASRNPQLHPTILTVDNPYAYNVLAIPLAFLGLLHPVIAEIAMASSSITVITNANLLRRTKLLK